MSEALEGLRGVVHPEVLERAEHVSRSRTALGIPHALVGGLAVGVHGHPRLTKDVDFLVGPQAFEQTQPFLVFRAELTEPARVGFSDLMSIPLGLAWLEDEIALADSLPVISLPGLVAMKLLALRPQDQADVAALLQVDEARLAEVSDYLADRAPELLIRLGELLDRLGAS